MSKQSLLVHLSENSVWSTNNGVAFSGNVNYDGVMYTQNNALKLFSPISSFTKFKSIIEGMNGFFTVIVETESSIFLGASHTLTIPLFYSEGDNIYISDQYYWIEEQIPKKQIPEPLISEFLYSSHVFGDKTLHPNIKQLKGGQVIKFSKEHNCVVSNIDYYQNNIQFKCDTRSNVEEKLTETLDKIFRRVKKLAQKRPIILLLSGGYDSRLAALQLFEHDIENVYAVSGNWSSNNDIELGKQISNQLGFKWFKIQQTRQDFNKVYESEDWVKIEKMIAGHGTTSPNPTYVLIRDYIKNEPDLPNDGIIITGMTPADGIELPQKIYSQTSIPNDKIVDLLYKKYYNNGPENEWIEHQLKERILQLIEGLSLDEIKKKSSLNENKCFEILFKWYLLGRDVSASEYLAYKIHGYDVWHPFEDKEFLQFFSSLPTEYQYERNLLERYTEEKNDEVLKDIPIGTRDSKIESMKKIVIGTPIEKPAKLIKQTLVSNSESEPTPLEVYESNYRYGFMTPERFENEFSGEEHRRYFLAKDALDRSELKVNESVVPN